MKVIGVVLEVAAALVTIAKVMKAVFIVMKIIGEVVGAAMEDV